MSNVTYDPFSLGSNKKESTTPEAYNPSEGDRKIVKKVNDLLEKAKQNRSRFDQKWSDYYNMFRGKQWKDKQPSYRHAVVINMVFQTIQSIVPIMTDVKPKFEFIATEPSDYDLANIINEISEWDWSRYNWSQQLVEVIYDSHFFGTGLSKIYFDPQGENGIGSICYESTDPFYNFPDPNASDCNKKCDYYIYAEPMDLSKIKEMFPEKGKFVKADLGSFNQLDKSDPKSVRYVSPSPPLLVNDIDSTDAPKQNDKCLLITCFLKDEEIEEKEEKKLDEMGNEQLGYVQTKKYPQGRLIQIASNIVLRDEENFMESGEFPYQRLINYINPRQFWGISEVEQLESPQKMFNRLVSFAMDVTMLMSQPIWLVDTTAGIDTDNLTNRPGLIVEKNPGTEVRRETGVGLQPHVLAIIDRLRTWFDSISGANDITRGIRPEGVNAALAIQELQQAAQTRIRLKSRNLDAYLQDLGRHYLQLIMQYYSIPRIVRITNRENAQLQDYFKFYIDTNEENKKTAKISRYQYSPDHKQYFEGQVEEKEITGNFDVKVTTGSSLPFSKAEKESRLLNLFDRGIIDAEEVLKNLDYPNYQALLQRLMAAKAQMPPQPAG